MKIRIKDAGKHYNQDINGGWRISKNLITVIPVPGIQRKQRALSHGICDRIQLIQLGIDSIPMQIKSGTIEKKSHAYGNDTR